jgi:hypothetical protein
MIRVHTGIHADDCEEAFRFEDRGTKHNTYILGTLAMD